MPYRRLPNTDQARIQSLTRAVEQGESFGELDLPYAYSVHTQAVDLLEKMERANAEYQVAYERQVNFAKDYQKKMKMAKLKTRHSILKMAFVNLLNTSMATKNHSSTMLSTSTQSVKEFPLK